MTGSSEARWRSIAKWLRNAGAICCCGFFLSFPGLVEVYYSSYRPDVPQPEHGWTTGLTWTHPVRYGTPQAITPAVAEAPTWTHPVRYGTPQDGSHSQWLFNLFFPSFALIISGKYIKTYTLGGYSGLRRRPSPPWDHKWGP
jgi:hypothetical protein